MIKTALVLLYYRIKCFQVSVNASFYYFIHLKIILSLIFTVQSLMWIFLIIVLSPLEILLLIILDILQLIVQTNDIREMFQNILEESGRTPQDIKREYEKYKEESFNY